MKAHPCLMQNLYQDGQHQIVSNPIPMSYNRQVHPENEHLSVKLKTRAFIHTVQVDEQNAFSYPWEELMHFLNVSLSFVAAQLRVQGAQGTSAEGLGKLKPLSFAGASWIFMNHQEERWQIRADYLQSRDITPTGKYKALSEVVE